MKYKSNAELQAESSYKLCMTCNVGVYQRDSTNYNEDGSHHVCVKTIYTVPPHVGVNGRANMTTDEAIADYASLWGDDKPNLELNKRDAKRCN